MTRRVGVSTVAIVTVGALLLAGCGGDSDDGGGNGGSGGSSAATSFTVQGNEFAFSPDSWTVAADQDVTITFQNTGAIEHEWTVLEAGVTITSEAEFGDELVAASVDKIAAGATATETLNLSAGSYQVICAIPGHFSAGMAGTLTVAP